MEAAERNRRYNRFVYLTCPMLLISVATYGFKSLSLQPQGDRAELFQRMSKDAESRGLAEPFKGVTTDGIRASELSTKQKEQLLDLIREYVSNMRDGHAKVKMDEVRRHIEDTRFAWIGGTEPKSVFYYRIQSPVILIEFDHQLPVGLRHLASDPRAVDREHIHTVVRTPNGNDYGKDLLRQHYEQHPHPHSHRGARIED